MHARFDSWFNGTGLSALEGPLGVTVPRCPDGVLGMMAVNTTTAGGGGNITTTYVPVPALPPGSLFATSRGGVCGFY